MDKEINEEKEFIQSFALELTNRTLEQREEIGKKYYKQLKRLQAENERLKEEVEHYRKEAYRLADGLNKIENLAFIYKQALQEIRDIVSEQCQQCLVIDGFTKPDDCGICDYKSILAKVNEVIGAEE